MRPSLRRSIPSRAQLPVLALHYGRVACCARLKRRAQGCTCLDHMIVSWLTSPPLDGRARSRPAPPFLGDSRDLPLGASPPRKPVPHTLTPSSSQRFVMSLVMSLPNPSLLLRASAVLNGSSSLLPPVFALPSLSGVVLGSFDASRHHFSLRRARVSRALLSSLLRR